MIFDGSPDRKWGPGEARQSRMVFIGRDLDASLFREGFESCLASSAAAVPQGAA
jgi:G3E family GTPase